MERGFKIPKTPQDVSEGTCRRSLSDRSKKRTFRVSGLLAVLSLHMAVLHSPASAMPRCTGTDLITNGGFELPTHPPGTGFFLEPEANVPAWSTTDTAIEIWQSGHSGVPSHTGVQHAELNANIAGTLTNTPTLVQPRAEVLVHWVHRGRGGIDVGALAITDDGGGATNPPNFSTGTAAWAEYTATHVVNDSGSTLTLAFTAISTGSGNISIGNFLDTVEVCQTYVTIDKSLVSITDSDLSGTHSIGDVVNYQYLVSNPAGNERGLSSVQIIDDVIGTFSATPTSGDDGDNILEPGETWTVNGAYPLVLADLNLGQVVNIAYAQGDTGDNVIRSDDDTVTANLVSAPDLTVTKAADDATDVNLNQTITYTFTVTNSGNQTITNISVADVHGGSGAPPIPDPESAVLTDNVPLGDSDNTNSGNGVWDNLAPGDVLTITANYIVTQSDIDNLQ